MSDDPLESKVQNDSYHYALSRGWFAEKIKTARRKGFPDYIFIRNGRVVFIEFKKDGEEPTIQQLRRHREMREHGAEVFVVDNYDDSKRILT